ncbi:MAG: aminoacyl-tRNA hydrolase [Acidobacteria bacterium]|nr:aminoacyl-tRNA hydrolase [Acidobacteriota bacterium]
MADEARPDAIFGLGNPGLAYRETRHNAGFLFLDYLIRRRRVPVRTKKRRYQAVIQEAYLFGQDVHLIKPQTFMNLSGVAYQLVLAAWHLSPGQTMVVYDDLDLPLGHFRIRTRGSSGGHRGMANIIERSGTQDIPRIRIGIRPEDEEYGDAAEYVLHPLTVKERQILDGLFERMYEALELIYRSGYERAMAIYNNPGGQ